MPASRNHLTGTNECGRRANVIVNEDDNFCSQFRRIIYGILSPWQSVALKLRLIAQSGKTDSRDFWHFDCCEFIDPLSLSLPLSLPPLCSVFICHLVGHVTLPHDGPHYPHNAAKRATRLQFRCRSSCVFNCPNKCSSFSCSSFCSSSWFLFTLSSAIRCLRRHVLASCRRLLPHRFIATCSACDLS